jgi:agmatine/peptidylarginine deiminase
MESNELFLCLSNVKLLKKKSIFMKSKFTFVLFLTFINLFVQAQQIKKDYRRLHYLSEEEMNTPVDIKDFNPTPPPEGFIRNVAEFDKMQGVLIRYPFGIPFSLIKEMAEDIKVITIVASTSQQQTVISQYQSHGVNLNNCDFLIAPTNTYWVRDYGPWFIFDGNNEPGIVDFPYNRPRPSDDDIPIKVAQYLNINLYGMDVEHTGGNYMCDGMGKAASTDLVLEENSISEQEIKNRVQNYLGVDDYFIMEDPLQEYIKHIDCWGKFLAPDKVLIGQVPESDWRYEDYEAAANFFKTHNSSYGEPYKVYRVYTPGSPTDTPYTNSLILNKKVLVPITGSQWDDEALAVYEEAMPGYEIIGIEYYGWINTDALHCRTKGIADLDQLYVWHIPVHQSVDFQQEYEVDATLYNYSGEPVNNDSVLLIYKINQSEYDTVYMQETDMKTQTYSGFITGALPGDTVSYYLYATDMAGNSAYHPFIGKPDPHQFIIKQTGLVFYPDTLVFTLDNAGEGLWFKLFNPTSEPVTIDTISAYGVEELTWYMDEDYYPEMPYVLSSGDSLILKVMYNLPVMEKTVWLYDTVKVWTVDSLYHTIVKVDSLITTMDGIGDQQEDGVRIFPNPFKDKVLFKWNGVRNYQLDIFDLTGRAVYKGKGEGNMARWTPERFNGKIFLYRLYLDGKRYNGKVIRR